MGRKKGDTTTKVTERHAAIVALANKATVVYPQTLRHIYYRCSGVGIVEKDHGNDKRNYHFIMRALDQARFSGALGWDRIIDGSRDAVSTSGWDSAVENINAIANHHVSDLWANQSVKPLVVTEKDAIVSMLEPLCGEKQVSIYPLKGHSSTTFLKDLASEIDDILLDNKQCRVFYLGDGDPAGINIDYGPFVSSPDFPAGKVRKLLQTVFGQDDDFTYTRIGITPEDIANPAYDAYKLPAHYGTLKPDKFREWVGNTDDITLGIDALPAEELIARTEAAINSCVDAALWQDRLDYQDAQRVLLREVALRLEAGA